MHRSKGFVGCRCSGLKVPWMDQRSNGLNEPWIEDTKAQGAFCNKNEHSSIFQMGCAGIYNKSGSNLHGLNMPVVEDAMH